ncbi:MAG TPA: SDR family NAD(P)-dependent oxidoreductase [Pirellulaceae bacterium]|nr:SDR family NAD(P)-dependent oxidoreductase [Pirellulaceae bacterium]
MARRIALVTGAGRGIGRSIALGLARLGHRLALTARSPGELDEVVREVEAAGGEAFAITADLAKKPVPQQVLGQIAGRWGAVEILINNAGVGSSANPKPLVDFDDDFWDYTLALNVTAPYLLTKHALPSMIAAGWGRIINISSLNAKIPALHGAAYTASKHAIAGLTKATAKEVAAHGITCNAVCPGVTATLMNDRRLEYDSARTGSSFAALEAAASPLGRRITPDEVAAAAVFFASEEAGAINGQLLNVCGGTVME